MSHLKKNIFALQHTISLVITTETVCLLCGMNWVFKQERSCFILNRLYTEVVRILTQHILTYLLHGAESFLRS